MAIQSFEWTESGHLPTCIQLYSRCVYIYAIFALLILLVHSQEPYLSISQTNRVFREGESLTYFCIIDTPVSGGTFSWSHYRNATGESSVYDINTHDEIPRVTVIEGTLSIRAKYSNLVIANASSHDSGILNCLYTYGSSTTVFVERNVCISSKPKLPSCSRSANGANLLCSVDEICPEDVTLHWFDANSLIELHGTMVNSNSMVQHVLSPDKGSTRFICTVESDLYSDIDLSCSIDLQDEFSFITPLSISITKHFTSSSDPDVHSTLRPIENALSPGLSLPTEPLYPDLQTPDRITLNPRDKAVTPDSAMLSHMPQTTFQTFYREGASQCSERCNWAIPTTVISILVLLISFVFNGFFWTEIYSISQ